ncbi:hypothetical protein LSCM1_08202 [Leishmania martiniquensis]|uniref:HSP70-like protein n=1 Tax=Leishmania martiniquensis TaxID=1580590 RepID=A0A836KZ03_9TRYP|nr:hypothetical protein LSCM1_08202 [Leishmania martiniquensis]
MRSAAYLSPRPCPTSRPLALRRCHRRGCARTTPAWMLLLLLSMAVLVLDGVGLAPFSDALLPRRRALGLFAMAAGEADAAAAAPPLPLTITETELISVDLGHDSVKVSAWRVPQQLVPRSEAALGGAAAAAVSLGSASIVLNDQANRKSPPCMAFRYVRDPTAASNSGGARSGTGPGMLSDGEKPHLHRDDTALRPRGYQLERTFAEEALALAPRFPMQVVCSAAHMLGYTADATSATAAESSIHALKPEQLRVAYSYSVAPLTGWGPAVAAPANGTDEVQQQRNDVIGRQALGVYVPFFTTSSTSDQHAAAGNQRPASAATANGVLFSPEELTAMLLGYARRTAEKADAADNALGEEDQQLLARMRRGAGNHTSSADATSVAVRYAALTVPIHSSVAQRQALVDAAALAGLRVVRLVHSTSGAAAQLAYMKSEQVLKPDKVQYVMIYDMGSQQAEVAIFGFAALPAAVASRTKRQGNMELLALVGNRTLGGAAFDACIAHHWDARYFGRRVLSGAAASEDRSGAARQTAVKERGSLLRAAQRAKEVLSANFEAHVTIDGIHADPSRFDAVGQQELQQRRVTVTADGGLLSLRLSREDFEGLCKPLFDAAVGLRDDAIAATGGLLRGPGTLDRLEVIGGGARIPLLLQRLGEGYRGGVVDRTLNGDEAAVTGTTLLAVSSAPRALGMRGTQALPRLHVREWLTNAIYASAELRSTDAEAAAAPDVRLLFPARNTTLPATRSLRVRLAAAALLPTDSVIVTLYSGPEADTAYASRKGSDAAPLADPAVDAASATLVMSCPACYVQVCTVEGVHEAAKQLLAQETQRSSGPSGTRPSRQQARLAGAEVVVEVVATVSGIPHCGVAYLRADVEVADAGPNVTEGVRSGSSAPGAAVEELPHKRNSSSGEGAGVAEGREGDEPGERGGEGSIPGHSSDSATASNESLPSQPHVEVHVEVRVAALPLRVSSSAAAAGVGMKRLGYNMNAAELTFSRGRVRALQAMDDARLRRSSLRNEIEGMLLWIKEKHPTWDSHDVQSEATSLSSPLPGWRTTVREVGHWLDDFGDTASVTELEERLRIIFGVQAAVREVVRQL